MTTHKAYCISGIFPAIPCVCDIEVSNKRPEDAIIGKVFDYKFHFTSWPAPPLPEPPPYRRVRIMDNPPQAKNPQAEWMAWRDGI